MENILTKNKVEKNKVEIGLVKKGGETQKHMLYNNVEETSATLYLTILIGIEYFTSY